MELQGAFQKRIQEAVMPLSLATAETAERWYENYAEWTSRRDRELERELAQQCAQMTDSEPRKPVYALISYHYDYDYAQDAGDYKYFLKSFHTDSHAAEEAKKKAKEWNKIHCSYEPGSNSDFDVYTVPQLPYEVTTAVYATINIDIMTMQFYKSEANAQRAITMVEHFEEVRSSEDGNSDVLPVLEKFGIV